MLFISRGAARRRPMRRACSIAATKSKLEDDLYWIARREKKRTTATMDDIIQKAYYIDDARQGDTHPDENSSPPMPMKNSVALRLQRVIPFLRKRLRRKVLSRRTAA